MTLLLGVAEQILGTLDYRPAARIARLIATQVLSKGLPPGILLNVNVPLLSDEKIQGVHITRQDMRVYDDHLERRIDTRGTPYYWIGGNAPSGIPENGTDIGALNKGYVSINPLQLDLTAYPVQQALSRWDWSLKNLGDE